MKVYVVEDEIIHLDDMLITLIELNYECVGHSNDAFEALQQIETLQPDVILMDIHLRGKQVGITLAKKIKKQFNIAVIFTTSDIGISTMSEAIEAQPVSYIIKPINKNDLQAALLLAQNQKTRTSTNKKPSEIFIKTGKKLIKVPINSILFAHTDTKNYCTIVTDDNKKLTIRNSILGIQQLLTHKQFIQTHRSYIINWQKVDAFYEGTQSIEINGNSIPLGRSFKKSVYERLQVL